MTRFLRMPKSPGLVVLNHELSVITVGGFTASFPLIAQNGWTWRSLAQVIGQAYQNAKSSTSDDVSVKGVLLVQSSSSTTTTTSTTMNSETASRTASSPGRSATGRSSSSAKRTSHASLFVLISIAFMSVSIFS